MRVSLLLAGGEGRRFGRRDKLLERLSGEELLARALRSARAAAPRTILILPPGFARRRALVAKHRGPRLIVRTARDARQGLGASAQAGLAALRPIDREVMIFLADMPFVGLGQRWRLKAGDDAVRPRLAGIPGHPMLVRAHAVRGRAVPPAGGLGALLDRQRVRGVLGAQGSFLDIDTPTALRVLRRRIAAPGAAFRLQTKERRCSQRPRTGSPLPRR